jgi:transmembrane sensor
MAQQDPARADAEALEWLLALHEAPEDADLNARFEAWRLEDPVRAEAWAQAVGVYGAIGRTPPAHAERWRGLPGVADAAGPAPRRARTARRAPLRHPDRRRLAAGLAASAAAVLAVAVLAPGALARLGADYVTGVGEVRQVRLDDGSVVSLGPDSALEVDYAADHRQVRLLKGQAWFDVRRNPARPFQVRARDVDTTVLGTAFEVDTAAKASTVAVQRGLVGVSARAAARRPMERVPAGRAVIVGRDGGVLRVAVPADRVAAWRDGQLVVENGAIGEVVAALKPWSRDLILVRGSALAARRVTGVYDLRDPEAVVQALAAAYDLRATRVTPWILVLSER